MIVCWRKFLRILEGCDGPRVAVPPSGRVQVDAGQERGEIGGGHLDATGRGLRDAEGPALEPLGPDGQAIAVPVQDLDAIASLVDEDEEVAGEGIDREATYDQRGEAVEALTHIGRFFGKVNTDGGAQSEHGRSSTTARSWRRVWGSKPGATAILRPLLSSSSRGCPEAAVAKMGSGVMVTGRKWGAVPSEEGGFAGVGFGVGAW